MFGVLAVAQPNGDSKFVEALYDYDATQEGDLGFKLGDKIEIIKDCGWIMHCSQSALCVVVHHMLCQGPRLHAYSVCCVVRWSHLVFRWDKPYTVCMYTYIG